MPRFPSAAPRHGHRGAPVADAGASSAEMDLLLLCLRPAIDAGTARHIAALAASSDWDRLFAATRDHRVVGLTCWNLLRYAPDSLSRESHRTLVHRYAENLKRNLMMRDEAADLVSVLARHGIHPLCFKGLSLVTGVYGHMGQRDFTDLDFLFRPRDLDRAARILADRGYNQAPKLQSHEDRIFRRYHFAYHFERDDELFEVDAHWSLFPRNLALSVDHDALWRRAVPMPFGEATVLTLAPEDHLLYVTLHGTKEGWRRLRMVCDVAHLSGAHGRLDWDAILRRAGEQGGRRALLLGVGLADRLLGTGAPAEVLRRTEADRIVRFYRGQIAEALRQGLGPPYAGVFNPSWFRLRMLDAGSRRLSYLTATLLRPRLDYMRMLPLPSRLGWAHGPAAFVIGYGLMPLWPVARHVGEGVGLLRRRPPADGALPAGRAPTNTPPVGTAAPGLGARSGQLTVGCFAAATHDAARDRGGLAVVVRKGEVRRLWQEDAYREGLAVVEWIIGELVWRFELTSLLHHLLREPAVKVVALRAEDLAHLKDDQGLAAAYRYAAEVGKPLLVVDAHGAQRQPGCDGAPLSTQETATFHGSPTAAIPRRWTPVESWPVCLDATKAFLFGLRGEAHIGVVAVTSDPDAFDPHAIEANLMLIEPGAIRDPDRIPPSLAAFAADPGIELLVVQVADSTSLCEESARTLAHALRGRPAAVAGGAPNGTVLRRLQASGIPVFPDLAALVRALRVLDRIP